MYRPNWKETLLKEYDSVNQSVVMRAWYVVCTLQTVGDRSFSVATACTWNSRKCQNMWKNMQYAHFAKICEKCGKVPNIWQSHIRVFLTCLIKSLHICLSTCLTFHQQFKS